MSLIPSCCHQPIVCIVVTTLEMAGEPHSGVVDPNPSEAVPNQVDSIAVVSSASPGDPSEIGPSPVAPSGVSPNLLVLPTWSFQLVLTRSLQLVPTRSLPLELVPTRSPTRSGPVELFPVQSVLVPAHLISVKLIPILFILVEQSIQFHSFPVQIIPMQCFPVGLFLVPSTLV